VGLWYCTAFLRLTKASKGIYRDLRLPLKGNGPGIFSYIVGIGLLPASIIAGLLFAVSPAAPFVFGAL